MPLADLHRLASEPSDAAPRSERFWTVPNGLSLLRLGMGVPFVYGLESETDWGDILAWSVLAIGFVTDALDGLIARRFNQASRWGLFLDPLADKISILVLGMAVVWYRGFPLTAYILILCRDAYVFLGALALYRQYGVPSASHPSGKWGATLVSLSMIAYLAYLEMAGTVLLVVALVMYAHSTWEYTVWARQARDNASLLGMEPRKDRG